MVDSRIEKVAPKFLISLQKLLTENLPRTAMLAPAMMTMPNMCDRATWNIGRVM